MSWFDDNNYNEATPTGRISQQQADTINRLMQEGVSLAEISTATGLSLCSFGAGGTNSGANKP
jgi:hypothetical protein